MTPAIPPIPAPQTRPLISRHKNRAANAKTRRFRAFSPYSPRSAARIVAAFILSRKLVSTSCHEKKAFRQIFDHFTPLLPTFDTLSIPFLPPPPAMDATARRLGQSWTQPTAAAPPPGKPMTPAIPPIPAPQTRPLISSHKNRAANAKTRIFRAFSPLFPGSAAKIVAAFILSRKFASTSCHEEKTFGQIFDHFTPLLPTFDTLSIPFLPPPPAMDATARLPAQHDASPAAQLDFITSCGINHRMRR